MASSNTKIEKIKLAVFDALFPKFCIGCKKTSNKEDSPWLCENCLKLLRPRWQAFCPYCEKPLAGISAPSCAHQSMPLTSAACLFEFKTLVVRALLHAFKYYGVLELLPLWQIAINTYRLEFARFRADVILPIPLHPRRERERGFNQSVLIANMVYAETGLPIMQKVLLRRRGGPKQMKLKTRRARARNIQGIFKVRSGEDILGKRIILVDDVVTTGATLQEAARTLRAAGAEAVFAFALAKD